MKESILAGLALWMITATLQAVQPSVVLTRGVNVIGYDPIWRNIEKGRIKAEHFRLIKQAGFDHVRINLHPFRHMKDGNKLPERWFKVLDWTLEQTEKNGLAAILDCHEYNRMGKEPKKHKDPWLAFWRQVAPRYKHKPNTVLFELLNEPHGKLTPKLWNKYLAEALAIVRESNPERTVIIGPGDWNSRNRLDELRLPEKDPNIIVTCHYYDPFKFTHQGAPWVGTPPTGIKWQGTRKERKAMARDFDKVAVWSKGTGRRIYLGEFGAYGKADMESRVRWTSAVARAAEERGIAWGYWQFDSDFVVYDIDEAKWIEEILDALIPKK